MIAVYATSADPCALSAMTPQLGMYGHEKHKETHVMSGVAIAPMGARESGAEAAVPFAFFVAMAPETGTKGQAKATMPDVRRRQRNP